MVCGGGPYTPDQVAAALEFERADRVDQIPADSRAAASLVDGSAATVFGLTRTRLVRAAGQLADRAVAQISTSTATTDLTSSASTASTPSTSPGVGS